VAIGTAVTAPFPRQDGAITGSDRVAYRKNSSKMMIRRTAPPPMYMVDSVGLPVLVGD